MGVCDLHRVVDKAQQLFTKGGGRPLVWPQKQFSSGVYYLGKGLQ